MSLSNKLESEASGSKMEELLRREEDAAIAENLAHFDKFLDTLKGRGTVGLSQEQMSKIDNLKDKFIKVVAPLSPKKIVEKSTKLDRDYDLKPKGIKKSGKEAAVEESSPSDDSTDDSRSTSSTTADTTNQSSSDGSEGYKKKKPKKKFVKKIKTMKPKKEKKHGQESEQAGSERQNGNRKESDIEMLVRAFSRLDGRKVPAQEKFDEKTGQDLKRYLMKFESYCDSNFKGDRSLWIGELERHLSGKVLEALQAVRDVDDSYEQVKEKLLEWYNNMKNLRKKKNRSRYEKAQFVHGESVYLYSSRLEKLYRVAHPNHNVKTSKSIQEKFQASIPKSARTLLASQIMSYKLNNNKITWKVIQQCARYYDLEKEKEQIEDRKKSQESEEEVVISVGQKRRFRDIATQNDPPVRDLCGGNVVMAGQSQSEVTGAAKRVPHTQSLYSSGTPYQHLQGQTGLGMYSPSLPQYMPGYPMAFGSSPHAAGCRAGQGYSPYPAVFGGNQRTPASCRLQPIFDRPSPYLANKTVICTFCNRLRHTINNCRTKWNCCYWCGSAGHYFRQCPQHNMNDSNRFNNCHNRNNNNRDQNNKRSQSQTRFPQGVSTGVRGGHHPIGQQHESRRRYNSGPGNLNANSLA